MGAWPACCLGDARQYPGLHDHLVARLACHAQEKPKIFKAVGNKRRCLAQTHGHWCSLLARDARGRRWSLPAGRLAAPPGAPHLDGPANCFCYALWCFCWPVRSSSPFCHSGGKREQTHSIQPSSGFTLPRTGGPDPGVRSRSGRRAGSAVSHQMYRLDNGLTMILAPRPLRSRGAPRRDLSRGSSRETVGKSGFAHSSNT